MLTSGCLAFKLDVESECALTSLSRFVHRMKRWSLKEYNAGLFRSEFAREVALVY